MKHLEISVEPKKYNKLRYAPFDFIADNFEHNELNEYLKGYAEYTFHQYQIKFYKELMKKISVFELSIYRKVCEKAKETEKELNETFYKHADEGYEKFAEDFE